MTFGVLNRLGQHAADPQRLGPGDYLTDGLRLFRVAARVTGGGHLLVGLEDCLTLEVRAYARNELELMRLRVVRSAGLERSLPSGIHGCGQTRPE